MYQNNNSPINIIQGGASSFFVRLISKLTGEPFPLAGATAITTCFYNTDGTELVLAVGTGITVINAAIGKIQISLTAAQTALLFPINSQTLEVSTTFTGDPNKTQIWNAYNVLESVC